MQPQTKSQPLEQIYPYLLAKGVKLTKIQEELYQETIQAVGPSFMISSKDQARFFEILIKIAQCKKGIEVGTFTGFSALSFAYGLPEDGKLITLDINNDWAKIGEKYWKKAGMDKKIQLRIGPALESLKDMQNEKEIYDFAFIDADKDNYLNYFEAILPLIKPNGFILVDNVLFHGAVIVPEDQLPEKIKEKLIKDNSELSESNKEEELQKKIQYIQKGVEVIKKFNDLLTTDDRIDATILQIADGISLIRKK